MIAILAAMNDDFEQALTTAVSGLHQAFGDDLVAVVLFGSAAEHRQRVVSDTNVAVVVRTFEPARAAAAREVIALASIALRLRLLLLRSSEISDAASAFAVKFSDIQRRRRVLYGNDVFAAVQVPRAAAIAQLHQALLNLLMRLREMWLTTRDDHQLGLAIARMAGGLRACAAELLTLEGVAVSSSREALEQIAGNALPELQAARADTLPDEGTVALLQRMLELAELMRVRAAALA